jgi:hypothetical protein
MKRLLQTLSQKWPEYLLEILVLIIGIYGAFALNNWNESNNQLEKEKAILEELDKNLKSNKQVLEEYIQTQKKSDEELNYILNHIEQQYEYNDTLGVYLRNVRKGEYLSLASSAYKSLESQGFYLIESSELKMEIIQLFDQEYKEKLNIIASITELHYQSTHEIFVKNLVFYREPFTHLKPNNYSNFLQNKEIYNLISFRKAAKEGAINIGQDLFHKTMNLQMQVKKILN